MWCTCRCCKWSDQLTRGLFFPFLFWFLVFGSIGSGRTGWSRPSFAWLPRWILWAFGCGRFEKRKKKRVDRQAQRLSKSTAGCQSAHCSTPSLRWSGPAGIGSGSWPAWRSSACLVSRAPLLMVSWHLRIFFSLFCVGVSVFFGVAIKKTKRSPHESTRKLIIWWKMKRPPGGSWEWKNDGDLRQQEEAAVASTQSIDTHRSTMSPPLCSLFPFTGGWGMEGNLFGTWVTLHADQYSDGKVFAPTQQPNQTLNTNTDRVRRKRKKKEK